MSLATQRERRKNAGSKIAKLLNQEEDADDEFYKTAYGGFNEVTLPDSNWFASFWLESTVFSDLGKDKEDEEFEVKEDQVEEDYVDSDFDADENEEIKSNPDDDVEEKQRKKTKQYAYMAKKVFSNTGIRSGNKHLNDLSFKQKPPLDEEPPESAVQKPEKPKKEKLENLSSSGLQHSTGQLSNYKATLTWVYSDSLRKQNPSQFDGLEAQRTRTASNWTWSYEKGKNTSTSKTDTATRIPAYDARRTTGRGWNDGANQHGVFGYELVT
jgi:hypothetical protein